MSTRVFAVTHKTNTTNTEKIQRLLTRPLTLQVTNILSHEALSFHELADMFPYANEKMLGDELAHLVETGVVARHFVQNQIVYSVAKPYWRQTIETLYELWAEQLWGAAPSSQTASPNA